MSRKHDVREPKRPLLVLTSNAVETCYFLQMRRDCRYGNMSVSQKSDSSENLHAVIREAGKLRRDFNFASVWCIVNPVDVHIEADKESEYRQLAKTKKVSVVYNSPGIETWLYLHFEKPETDRMSRKNLADKLAEKIPGFRLEEEYFHTGEGKKLYLRLFPNKSQAVLHADLMRKEQDFVFPGSDPERLSVQMPAFLAGVIDGCGRCFISQG
ncbi:MAG: RloB domain-containing protein [Spirochaetales bacterium]|nr:RloB domain-containing protein [Spirochaetales bacterium]